jgi:hypothetical protein
MSAATGGGLRLLDLAALVVGYGLAAVAVRAFWPRGVSPTLGLVLVAAPAYAWLGLAMSGPFVLLLNRPRRSPRDESRPFSRAETAWLLIGAYWIAAGLLIVPTRLPNTSLGFLATVPWLAAALLWLLSARPVPRATGWTHRAAVLVLATWPLAWGAMIVLTLALLD